MSRIEPEHKPGRPLEVEPGALGPGPDELVASGEIDEPVSQGMFLELTNLMGSLKERRKAAGLSLSDVADKSGLTRQAISRLENGWNNNPTLDTLYRYALALDASITLGFDGLEVDEVDKVSDPIAPAAPAGPKPVVLEFEGGFKDGKRVNSANPTEFTEAFLYYNLSNKGEIGRRHWSVSEAGLQEFIEIYEDSPEGPRLKREPNYGKRHIYEVISRIEDDYSIVVKFRFMGSED